MNGGWRCVTHALQEIGVLLSLGFPLPGAWQQWARCSPPPTSCSRGVCMHWGKVRSLVLPPLCRGGKVPSKGWGLLWEVCPFSDLREKANPDFVRPEACTTGSPSLRKRIHYETMWDLKITIYVKQEKKSQPISNLKNADQYHKHHKVHTNDKRFQ